MGGGVDHWSGLAKKGNISRGVIWKLPKTLRSVEGGGGITLRGGDQLTDKQREKDPIISSQTYDGYTKKYPPQTTRERYANTDNV